MIIECINCHKKFVVNSDLIPTAGRNIQCGSCNHLWFFKPDKIQKEISEKQVNVDNELYKVDKFTNEVLGNLKAAKIADQSTVNRESMNVSKLIEKYIEDKTALI